MQKCPKCGLDKPLSTTYFKPKRENVTGLMTICRACTNAADRQWRNKRYQYRKLTGICVVCGKANSLSGLIWCFNCWVNHAAKRLMGDGRLAPYLKRQWLKQEGRCYYTNYILTPGLNASIEHRVPRSIDSGLVADPSNLVWCDVRVNAMKHNLREEEFLSLVEDIYASSVATPSRTARRSTQTN